MMEEDIQKRNETFYKLLYFYKDKGQKVHIVVKSKEWYNGEILNIDDDFQDRFTLLEEKFGEMLIFFDRIMDDGITPFKEKKEVGE